MWNLRRKLDFLTFIWYEFNSLQKETLWRVFRNITHQLFISSTVIPQYTRGIGSRTTHVHQNLPILKLHGQPGGTCVYEKPYIYAGFPSLNNVLSNSVQLKKKIPVYMDLYSSNVLFKGQLYILMRPYECNLGRCPSSRDFTPESDL